MPFRSDSPLYTAINAYAARGAARFHMPGHKGGLDAADVTEVPGTDNLACPQGAIAELEELCAEAFGARDSLISVNGSTCCNIAMLLSLPEGSRVLLGRNCHKSVISGLALAGLEAEPLFPDEYGVVTPQAVAAALEETPCAAVFITSPTYRGFVCDIEGIAKEAHVRGALLFADCAHGAHFGFCKELPPAPAAADMWCVSCHKTLDALNQTAVLNLGRGCPFSKGAVRSRMNLVQTSSPSYPLMLSVENAIKHRAEWAGHTKSMLGFVRRLEGLEGLRSMPHGTAFSFDPTRLNLRLEGMTGYELGRYLESRNIFPEMYDAECVTLITTPSDRPEWYDMLYDALKEATRPEGGAEAKASAVNACDFRRFAGEWAFSVRDALLGLKRSVPLELAAGCISAGAVGVYPPGVAVLFPGETIKKEAVRYLLNERAAGAELFGVNEGSIDVKFCKISRMEEE